MAILYQRRNNLYNKKKDTLPNGNRKCPHCGKEANPVAAYDDRTTYKCSHCNAENTYVNSIVPPKKPAGEEQLGTILLRDTSKTDKKEEKKKEEKKEDSKEQVENGPMATRLETVRKGMTERKLVQFVYMDKTGKKSTRLVEPYKLMKDRDGNLILYAYCTEGQGIRVFKLLYTSNLSVQDYSYDPRWPVEDTLRPK